MRVRLLRHVFHDNRDYPAGVTAEFSDGLGRALVEGGAAEQLKALHQPPANKAILRSPRDKTKETSPDGQRI